MNKNSFKCMRTQHKMIAVSFFYLDCCTTVPPPPPQLLKETSTQYNNLIVGLLHELKALLKAKNLSQGVSILYSHTHCLPNLISLPLGLH